MYCRRERRGACLEALKSLVAKLSLINYSLLTVSPADLGTNGPFPKLDSSPPSGAYSNTKLTRKDTLQQLLFEETRNTDTPGWAHNLLNH